MTSHLVMSDRLKGLLESNILSVVKAEVHLFQQLTGLAISSIDISLHSRHTLGHAQETTVVGEVSSQVSTHL